MRKAPVKIPCLIELPPLCPHNKFVKTIGIKYRYEQPVRLTKVAHLKRLGGQHMTSGNSVSSDFQQLPNVARQVRAAGGGEEVYKNDSIFSCNITNTVLETSGTGIKEGLPVLRTSSRSHGLYLLNKVCQSYRKSKNYFTTSKLGRNKKDSVTWIMRPLKELRKESTITIDAPKKQESNSLINQNPINEFSNVYSTGSNSQDLSKTLSFETLEPRRPYNGPPFSKFYLSSITASSALPELSTDNNEDETETLLLMKNKRKTFKSLYGNEAGNTVIEFYNTEFGLEDIQYKKSEDGTIQSRASQIEELRKEMKKNILPTSNGGTDSKNLFKKESDASRRDLFGGRSIYSGIAQIGFNSKQLSTKGNGEHVIKNVADEIKTQNRTKYESMMNRSCFPFACQRKKPLKPEKSNFNSLYNKRKNQMKRYAKISTNSKRNSQDYPTRLETTTDDASSQIMEKIKEAEAKKKAEKIDEDKLSTSKVEKYPETIKNKPILPTLYGTSIKNNDSNKPAKYSDSIVKPTPLTVTNNTNTTSATTTTTTTAKKLLEYYDSPKTFFPRKTTIIPNAANTSQESYFLPGFDPLKVISIKNENFTFNNTNANKKKDINSMKPFSVPIYYHSPVVQSKRNNAIPKVPCKLLPHERVLFEKNHF